MENIYFNCILIKKIVVQSKFLNENINEYISSYIKSKIENHCVDEGFIKEDSIKILKKSAGMLIGSRFTGDITYEVAYTAQVCNPMVGNIIECKVKFINKLGLLGNNGPITIIVGKQFHSNDNDLNKIGVGDIVKVEVIAKKYSLNDKEIKVIAKLWDNKKTVKKELISSDLTPIVSENDFIDLDNQDIQDIISDNEENEDMSVDEDQEDELSEEEDEVKIENPDDNLGADDIEIDESDSVDEFDDDANSVTEY